MDFGTNRYFALNWEWYYAGNDGAILKGLQTIDGVKVYFRQGGAQVKDILLKMGDMEMNDIMIKILGALASNQYVIAYNPYKHRNERYYVNDQGIRLTGPQTIDGKQVYFDTYEGSQVSTILLTMVTFTIRTEIVLILVPIVMFKSETIGTMSVTMEKF